MDSDELTERLPISVSSAFHVLVWVYRFD